MNRPLPRRLIVLALALVACKTSPLEQPPDDTAPTAVAPPVVTGTAQEAELLSSTNGTWEGSLPMTYSHQWTRCNDVGSACVNIPGATGATYIPTSGDVGSTIRSSVTATNDAGSATSQSAATLEVTASSTPPTAPSNTGAPTITGTAQEGLTLSTTTGSWSGTTPMTYARQWRRCDASAAACTDIASAVGTTYLLTASDVGSTIRVSVTASNGAGSASASSAATGIVAEMPEPSGDCPTLDNPPPGYCTGDVYVVTPSSPAIPALQPGDVVVFENGTYTDTNADGSVVVVQHGGTASQYVTFVARNKWGAKLDGQSNTTRYGISFAAVSYVRIEGFDIFGFGSEFAGTVAAPSASGIMLQNGGAFSQIVNNHIHHISNFCNETIRAQTGIFLQRSSVLVEGNVIHDVGRHDPGENGCTYAASFNKYKNSDTGIYVQSPGHSNHIIRNNIFYNHRNGWAIFFYQGGPENVKILNNTFANGNPYWSYTHIFTDADLVDFQIRNNVFHDPAGGYVMAWDLEPLVNVVVSNNVTNQQFLISGANGAPITTLPPGLTETNNKWQVNPLLTDPASYDFHLLPGSPAIDAGFATSDVTHDIERRTRPQGSAHDAGAYERPGGSD